MRESFIAAIEVDPTDESARRVFADWCEENGEMELAKELRRNTSRDWRPQPLALRPVIEITIEQLRDSYDWLSVFGEEGCSSNESNETDPCPPTSDVDTTPPTRKDVVEIIAAVNGENDAEAWTGVFRLKDGRFLLADGSCDYTGWG